MFTTLSSTPIMAVEQSILTQGLTVPVISAAPVHLIPITFQELQSLMQMQLCTSKDTVVIAINNNPVTQPEQKEVKSETSSKKQTLKKVNILKNGRTSKKKVTKNKTKKTDLTTDNQKSPIKSEEVGMKEVDSAYEIDIFDCLDLKSQLGPTTLNFKDEWMTSVSPSNGELECSVKNVDVEMLQPYPYIVNEQERWASESVCSWKSDYLLAQPSAKIHPITHHTSRSDQQSYNNFDPAHPRSIFDFDVTSEEIECGDVQFESTEEIIL